mgnify:CR=1 FL=1
MNSPHPAWAGQSRREIVLPCAAGEVPSPLSWEGGGGVSIIALFVAYFPLILALLDSSPASGQSTRAICDGTAVISAAQNRIRHLPAKHVKNARSVAPPRTAPLSNSHLAIQPSAALNPPASDGAIADLHNVGGFNLAIAREKAAFDHLR